MKTRLTLIALFLLLTGFKITHAQNNRHLHIKKRSPKQKMQCEGARAIICNSCHQPYILKTDGKIFESPLIDTIAEDSFYKSIKRSWSQPYDLISDPQVCNRYGLPGCTFVVSLLNLKEGTLEKLPLYLRDKFVTEEIKSILVKVNEHDDSPKPARISLIEFQVNKSGLLLLSKYTINGKRKHIDKVIEIDKQRISTFMEWEKSNRRKFNLNDFIGNKSRLFGKDNETIKIDSFEFCHKYSKQRCSALGGYSIEITVTTNAYSEIIFRHTTEDDCSDRLDLRGYLLAYKLLNNKLPDNFPKMAFFTAAKFNSFLTDYFDTIECEDFYYDEFIKKHPERTSVENRMRASWDFQKYLKERKKEQ